ncbi:hypothetical protein GQ53DRAFT_674961 [Thozetella sp. PMI_491]|nr:hypothetical protein GQ53DRAFT_674961 [Thozetella sp. PMI_491]
MAQGSNLTPLEQLRQLNTLIPPSLLPSHDRPLVLYVYAQSETSRENLEFFVKLGLHQHADFIFVFNGESDAIDLIPQLPNVRTVQRENTCYDLGTYGQILQQDNLWKKYSRFITINASVRGPFLPAYATSCWTDYFLNKVTDKVKLVGTTFSCGPRPHAQSMVWATDSVGMAILLDRKLALEQSVDDFWATAENPVGLSGCYENRSVAVHAEIGTTRLIRSQGYEIDVMMTAFQAEPDIETYCEVHNGTGDVMYNGSYFGANLHPYEAIFAKTNRGIDEVLMRVLTQWHLQAAEKGLGMCN